MKSRNNGIIVSYLNTIINMLCGLFLSAYLIRGLGSTDYGIYQTISSFANCLVLFEFGIGTVLVRNVSMALAKKEGNERIEREISTIFVITLLLSVVILVIASILYFKLDVIYGRAFSTSQIEYGKIIFLFVVGYLIVSFWLQMFQSITLAYEHYSFKPQMVLCSTVIRTVLIVIFIKVFCYSLIIAVVDLIVTAVSCIYTWYFCKKKFKISFNIKKFDSMIFQSSLPLCIAIFFQSIVNQANSNVDKFLIGIFLSPESVTIYSIGLYIYNIFSSVTTIPISMYAPKISSMVAKEESMQMIVANIIQPCRLIVLIGGTIFFGFISTGEQFVEMIYGAYYTKAWIIAIILMFPMLINMSTGVLINLLNAINKRMVRSIVLFLTTILNIVTTVIVIKDNGIVGAAIATMISTFLGQVIIMNIYYDIKLNIPIVMLLKSAFNGILRYQLLAMILALFFKYIIIDVNVSFLICGVIYISVFFIGYICQGCNKEEKIMIHNIKRKIGLK